MAKVKYATMPDTPVRSPWLTAPLLGLWLAGLVIGLDQLTKMLATEHLSYRVPVELTSWFDFTLAHNTGAAFSFLASAGGWQRWFLSGVALAVSVFVLLWLWRLEASKLRLTIALGLILGGGIGNLIDRVAYGYVVDFISVHYQNWYFPAFNVADSGITLGACLLLWDAFVSDD